MDVLIAELQTTHWGAPIFFFLSQNLMSMSEQSFNRNKNRANTIVSIFFLIQKGNSDRHTVKGKVS